MTDAERLEIELGRRRRDAEDAAVRPSAEPDVVEARRDVGALIAFINGRQNRPYAWGRDANDCVSFCLAAVEAQIGERIAPDLDWTDRTSALRLIKRFGSLENAIDTYFERVAPAQAHRGDIAGVPDDELGMHPMIVEGATLVIPGERGNRRAKRTVMVCAWSIEKLLS